MIVATAGHVDHGKTLLVKTLTGVDTDRLPEEKQRGMTIDLGFAYLPLANGPIIGFIDVPGHERFLRNMLCGVASIDFVLFVVAADDGPMPQTSEHLAILDLLGVSRGAVAITKCDRVGAERVAEVDAEIRALLAPTMLTSAPIFHVSAVTGRGIDALKSHLEDSARAWRPREARGHFRLAVDRRFNLVGAGLVVTGTVHAGAITVDDHAQILSSGLPVRVRSIHAQNTKSETGCTGQRCALNLTGSGVTVEAIDRGDWIVDEAVPKAVAKIDARIRILASEPRALTHWTPAHVHIGAADVTGRVALLETARLEPGQSGLAQLVLDRPIGALYGDGLILRDTSATRTVGGGKVIDIFPPKRGRARPERLAYLAAMEKDDDTEALGALLDASPRGLDVARFTGNRNLTEPEGVPMQRVGTLGFAPVHWKKLKVTLTEALAAAHNRSPDAVGPAEDRIVPNLSREVSAALVAELAREGVVVKEGTYVRLAAHLPKMSATDAALWRKVAPCLDEGGLRPPSLHEIATAIGENPKKLESFFVRAGRLGYVVRTSENRFFPSATLRRLGEIAEAIAGESERKLVTAISFRDRSAIGRNLTIEVLEYFDRIKFTRRIGDAHQVMRTATEAFGGSPATSDV
jgi:selenocysteine-specific elongation factor